MNDKKPNYFVRVLLTIFVIFLAVFALLSFMKGQPAYAITSGILSVLLLMAVVILSESFNQLSIGKLLSLSRDVSRISQEKDDLKAENTELRASLVQVATNIQSQSNTTIQAQGADLYSLLGVVKADKTKDDVEKEEEVATEIEKASATPSSRIPFYRIMRTVEGETLDRYIKHYDLPSMELEREMRFTEGFKGIDPISERQIVFDGYMKTPHKEYFFEVKIHDRISPMMYDRLYVMLSKVLLYRQVKKIPAELILLLAKIPDRDERKPSPYYSTEKLFEIFQPAIASNLLRIETISFSDNEYEEMEKKVVNPDPASKLQESSNKANAADS